MIVDSPDNVTISESLIWTQKSEGTHNVDLSFEMATLHQFTKYLIILN